MRKLIKKCLAICLVAALSLTLFAGALSVNAETALTGTITAATVEVEADATTATVPVTIASDAINTAKIQITSEFGAVSAITVTGDGVYSEAEDMDVASGTLLLHANDNVAGFTAATINVTFTAEAAKEAGSYAVNVTLVEVHAANYDETAVTLTPTAGAVVVKSAVVEPTAEDYVADVVITNSADSQSVTGVFTYTVDSSKALATYIKTLGTPVGVGINMTIDGSDPKEATDETGFVIYSELPEATWDYIAANGYEFGGNAYYTGMNLYQLATYEIKFVSYYTYSTADGLVTVYGDVKSQILIDYLRTQSDEKSTALVNAYELANAAEDVDVAGTTITLDENYGPEFTPSYNLHDISVTGTFSFTVAQSKAIASYLKTLGTPAGVGILMNAGGTEYDIYSELPEATWDYIAANGYEFGGNAYYEGMNIAQFASEISYSVYCTYKDANGDIITVNCGEVQTYTFNGMIADDSSELAEVYKDLYSTFIG